VLNVMKIHPGEWLRTAASNEWREMMERRVRRSRTRSPRRRPHRTALSDVLVSVWRQALVDGRAEVILGRRRYPVGFTKQKHLRTVSFPYRGRRFYGLEQNPTTKSRWAALARAGEPVMQFSYKGHYVANVSGGEVFRYPAWRSRRLPE
jgi:hypothetical protein